MAVAERRLDDLDNERLRTRTRLHDLESDRATLRMLVSQTKELSQTMDQVAVRAAEKALEAAFEHRAIVHSRVVDMRLRYIGFGLTVGGLLTGLLVAFLH